MEDEDTLPTLASRMWREVKWPLVGVALFLIGLVVVWALWPGLAPAGTGFGAYNEEEIGPRAKTLWDWLGLLIVPLAVAAGAAFISYVQKRTELDIAKKAREEDREIAQQARQSEQQIANDRLRQATLEGYYDRMTELLLEHGLQESAEDSKARSIARARTVAVVKGLDGERKGQLMAFLKASGLIEKDKPIIDLRGVDFGALALPWHDLGQVDLNEANLGGANLLGTNLVGANLRSVNLSHANLRGVKLNGADLYNVDIREADLRGAVLREANLHGAVLYGANVLGVKLNGADLSNAVLGGVDLSGVDLSEANLSWADLSEAKIDRSTKISDKWRLVWEIVNRRTNHRNLYGVDLRQASLMGADLREANLSEADLSEAVLSWANLNEANLRGANLNETNLFDANLRGANLSEADLNGADLSLADLTRVVGWTIEQFDLCRTPEATTMPDGVKLRSDGNPDRPTYEEWKAQYLDKQGSG